MNTFQPWNVDKVVNHDVVSYYSYLPAIFIHGDPTFEFYDSMDPYSKSKLWVRRDDEGIRTPKTFIGMSIMYAPGFLVGHLLASSNDDTPATGYSRPYYLMVAWTCLIYALLGLFFMSRVLSRYFSPPIVAACILLVGLATHLQYYAIYEAAMSHGAGFMLVSAFILSYLRWKESPSIARAVLLGAILGLILLVRPTDVLVALIPLLDGLGVKGGLRSHWIWLIERRVQLGIVLLTFCAVLSLQFIFWKMNSGNWYRTGYSGEGFFFGDPMIVEGLFGYHKGWLLYTPVMVFALIGFAFLGRDSRRLRSMWPALLIFLVVHVYVMLSWWSWWYGGGFGMRPMIDVYGILSIPLAACLHKVFSSRVWVIYPSVTLLGFFLYLNQFQTWQYRRMLIHHSGTTKELYWKHFLAEIHAKDWLEYVREFDSEAALRGDRLKLKSPPQRKGSKE